MGFLIQVPLDYPEIKGTAGFIISQLKIDVDEFLAT